MGGKYTANPPCSIPWPPFCIAHIVGTQSDGTCIRTAIPFANTQRLASLFEAVIAHSVWLLLRRTLLPLTDRLIRRWSLLCRSEKTRDPGSGNEERNRNSLPPIRIMPLCIRPQLLSHMPRAGPGVFLCARGTGNGVVYVGLFERERERYSRNGERKGGTQWWKDV